jgi:hypothetical protein
MLTTHPLLVPRLRKSRSYTSCHPDAPLWSVTGPLYILPFIGLHALLKPEIDSHWLRTWARNWGYFGDKDIRGSGRKLKKKCPVCVVRRKIQYVKY